MACLRCSSILTASPLTASPLTALVCPWPSPLPLIARPPSPRSRFGMGTNMAVSLAKFEMKGEVFQPKQSGNKKGKKVRVLGGG